MKIVLVFSAVLVLGGGTALAAGQHVCFGGRGGPS